ncbi:MAG: flagellar basal-body MS-ring/collar protein FliF, partial [Candidatus Poribacteria bacterium]|nr:flagellar basal-body MS-ring/collar protein FliF [Candidatus Poribacteria bacterium]
SIRNSIESLDPVKYAAVDITPMVDSPFAVEKEPAKASLTVELKHGRRLDYKQIDGIANMVAASVRGLTVDNVKIIDSFGRPLNIMPETTDQDLIVGLRNQQYEFEKRVAAELEQKIMRRMTPLVGNPQYVQAIVRVEGDFDEISTDQIEYNPTGLEAAEIPVETETTILDTTAGPGTTVGSQPGMVPNTIGSSSSLNPNQELTVTRNSSEKTRLVSKTTTTTKRAPAKIKKITATLLIDQRKQMDPNGIITYTPWTPAEEILLTNAVQTAIGYDETRGDQVSVVSLPFDRTYPAEQSTINTQKERLAVAGSAAKYVIVLVVVAALMLLMRSFFSGLGSTDAPQAQARVGGGGVAAISGEPSLEDDELSDEGLAGMGSDAAGILGDDDSGGALEGSEELEIARLQREISTSVQSNPEIVVALMRTWLESESET